MQFRLLYRTRSFRRQRRIAFFTAPLDFSTRSSELCKPIASNLDAFAIDYFKREAARTGMSCQRLIDLCLVQCAREEKHIAFA